MQCAVLPYCLLDDAPAADPRWRLGNLTVRDDALDFRGAREGFSIPTRFVQRITGVTHSLPPAPIDLDTVILVHHTDANGRRVASAVAYPRVTIGNFPLQLAAALTGTIPVIATSRSRDGAPTAEHATFAMRGATFVVSRGAREEPIPLEKVSSVTSRPVRLADGRDGLEWSLVHVRDAHVERIGFVGAERLPFLRALLDAVQGLQRNLTQEKEGESGVLDARGRQVATLLYVTNASASSVEQTLGLSPDDVDALFDDLVARGLAEVVKLRKEVRLTSAGVKAVDAIMKDQTALDAGVASG